MAAMIRITLLRYDNALRRYPLLVKCCTSGIILSSSDITAQILHQRQIQDFRSMIHDNSWYNPYQTFAAGICYGAFFFTPLMHNVFAFWARVLPSKSTSAVFFKTAIDCITSFPLNVSALITFQTLAREKSGTTNLQKIESVQQALEVNVWPTLIMGWKIWPPVTLLNYKFVPILYRVLLLNSVSYCWNVGLIFYTTPSKSS